MELHGSVLALPLRADQRGTLATVRDREGIVRQSILSIVETRQGERVMLPDYGLPDFVFSVIDIGFAARVAYHVEQQVRKYELLVSRVKAYVGSIQDEEFQSGITSNPHQVAIRVEYTVRGSGVPSNLVYPIWKLRTDVEVN